MSRTPKPHDSLYLIVRLDGEAAALDQLVAVPKAFRLESDAQVEAKRLNGVNAAAGSRYVVVGSRLIRALPSEPGATTRKGFLNPNGQVVVRATGLPGTDHLQRIYVLLCTQPGCGHEYGANGSDIHERRCPECQGGASGLRY
jgi:hypothetical protein